MEPRFAALLGQHDVLLGRLDALSEHFARVTARLELLVRYVDGDLARHFTDEEAAFPELARHADIDAPTLALFADEHAHIREGARALDEAIRHGTVASQVAAAETLIDLLRAHVAKEDAMLVTAATATREDS